MKLVIHISDPHFGQADPDRCEAMLDEINALRPTLVAISGDLTQARASRAVPGGARVARSADPAVPRRARQSRHSALRRRAPVHCAARALHATTSRTISRRPVFDEELAVCGVDTTKSFTFKRGRITRDQAERVAALLAPHTYHWRIVVAHHPFEHASGRRGGDAAARGRRRRSRVDRALHSAVRRAGGAQRRAHADQGPRRHVHVDPAARRAERLQPAALRRRARPHRPSRVARHAVCRRRREAYRRSERAGERIVKERRQRRCGFRSFTSCVSYL